MKNIKKIIPIFILLFSFGIVSAQDGTVKGTVVDDVSGETELEFSVDVSISIAIDEGGDSEELETLSFRNSDFQYVTLHPYEDYR